jgi:hypothetical protein
MLKKLFLTFSCMAMLSMALLVSAQPFSFKTFSLSEGLPQSQVTCTHIDQQGYLWIGTNGGGLCRYDGKEFEIFTEDKGMTSNFIRCLGEDQNGRLYVGTNRGMYVLSRYFHLTGTDAIPINVISGLWGRCCVGWLIQSVENLFFQRSKLSIHCQWIVSEMSFPFVIKITSIGLELQKDFGRWIPTQIKWIF